MDQPPQDPTQPTPPAPQLPSSQAVIPAPQGPVTGLSKVAGIIILLVGFGLTAVGGDAWADPFGVQPQSSRWIGELFGSILVVTGLPGLLTGIGILRGAEWGRVIGIIYSVLFGLASFAWGINNRTGPDNRYTPLFGLALVLLFAYSAIVLIARWRGLATA